MRLSELVGLDVHTADGRRLGYLADVRLVQDAPMIGPYSAGLRLDGIIVVQRRHTRLLGYDRDVGPWLLRFLVRTLTADVIYIPWDQSHRIEDGRLTLTASHTTTPLREVPRSHP